MSFHLPIATWQSKGHCPHFKVKLKKAVYLAADCESEKLSPFFPFSSLSRSFPEVNTLPPEYPSIAYCMRTVAIIHHFQDDCMHAHCTKQSAYILKCLYTLYQSSLRVFWSIYRVLRAGNDVRLGRWHQNIIKQIINWHLINAKMEIFQCSIEHLILEARKDLSEKSSIYAKTQVDKH